MGKLKVYSYDKCGTCKKALKFLDAGKVPYECLPIVEKPPTLGELKSVLGHLKERGLGLNKLFNTSGELYRSMGISEKLKSMSETEALKLLSQHGKLIKRPFVVADGNGLVGFNEEEWKKALKA